MNMLHATADPTALIRQVGALIDAGRCGAARPLLDAARLLLAPSPELSQLSARLAVGQGELDQAMNDLDDAVAMAPDHAGLRKQRAELCRTTGDLDCAARDAAEAVILDPADPTAKALLGVIMLNLGRKAEAVACLAEACVTMPQNPVIREALAVAVEANGNAHQAFDILMAGLSPNSGALNLRNAAILFCIRHRDYSKAVELAEEARLAGIVDACLFGLKGHAQSSLGLHAEAADSYAEALKLGPDDSYVRHLVASSGMLPSAKRAPPDYLREVFDGYANRFESHLISLGYQVPGAVRRVVRQYPGLTEGDQFPPVLDLGCGTGLIAVAISDLPIGSMTGVDVSGAMLAEASAKDLYASLHEADIIDFLERTTERWPLILAGDVLCYFGALESVFAAIRSCLRPDGWFIFSVEELQPDVNDQFADAHTWMLQRQGRYAHTMDYLVETARNTGFTLRLRQNQVIRLEAGAPVQGFLMVLAPDDTTDQGGRNRLLQ